MDIRFFRYFGFLFLLLAFFVWVVPIVEIQSNEVMLSEVHNPNFESGQIAVYYGSLRWWKNLYVNIIIPVVGILITTGLVTIVAPFILDLKHIGILKRFRNKYQTITLDDYFKPKDR